MGRPLCGDVALLCSLTVQSAIRLRQPVSHPGTTLGTMGVGIDLETFSARLAQEAAVAVQQEYLTTEHAPRCAASTLTVEADSSRYRQMVLISCSLADNARLPVPPGAVPNDRRGDRSSRHRTDCNPIQQHTLSGQPTRKRRCGATCMNRRYQP